MSINESDYERAIEILQDWMDGYSSSKEFHGQFLIDNLGVITCELPFMVIYHTAPFGSLLSRIEGEEIVFLMRVIMAHVSNPNFTLVSGFYKDQTFLQGAISTGNKELVKLLISNTHGSKLRGHVEPMIMDHKLLEQFFEEKEELALPKAIVV